MVTPVRSIVALVREVSPRLANCVLTHLGRVAIDVDRASAQHRTYCEALKNLGARVEAIAPLPDAPDGVFVEDTAVVVDEVAVIARPGVASRAGETATAASALLPYRRLLRLSDTATLEGGDVMQVGRTLYVGRSGRTNQTAIGELGELLAPWGYQVAGRGSRWLPASQDRVHVRPPALRRCQSCLGRSSHLRRPDAGSGRR